MSFDVTHPEVRNAVEHALAEDIGSGDVTSALTVPKDLQASGRFIAKQEMVLAGVELLPIVYEAQGGAAITLLHTSGDPLNAGDAIATVAASAHVLLRCERVALNFLQRLSGVATLASKHVQVLGNSKTKVLDTRKTTPGLRILEKMAARAGGVVNHRMGLFDAVLIKNNHITAAGGVRKALEKTSGYTGFIEIEVRTREELDEALDAGAKNVLLDNLTPVQAREWVGYINGRASVELSGNIDLSNIAQYAAVGADYVSCGAITHSATAVDISFRLERSHE